MDKSSKPIFYTGGGVINSGPKASELLRELVSATGFPITSTLQGLGAFPAGKAPSPWRVDVIGKPVAETNSLSSSLALGPELITPPPV